MVKSVTKELPGGRLVEKKELLEMKNNFNETVMDSAIKRKQIVTCLKDWKKNFKKF